MDILVLGANGMLGHKMYQVLKESHFDVSCTIRQKLTNPVLDAVSLFKEGNVIDEVDVLDFSALDNLLRSFRPKVIVNCVGVIKQRSESEMAIPSIAINSLLPHRLAELSQQWKGRLIHFSTDCVFSGGKGNYREDDFADAKDLYGRSKYLGEVNRENALTLRTSIIGRELMHRKSLLEWFLSNNHQTVRGYTRAFYSGVTTNYIAQLVARLIEDDKELCGLYQVTSHTISKFDLLCLLRDAYKVNTDILPDDKFFCDRSMVGEKFERATGYVCPEWPTLVAGLTEDETPYEKWRMNEQQTV